eukprot:scaffold179707_cov34-Tisochrysis_lutea.AAC.1
MVSWRGGVSVSASAAQRRRVNGDKKIASYVTKRGMVPDPSAEVCASLPPGPLLPASLSPSLLPAQHAAWVSAGCADSTTAPLKLLGLSVSEASSWLLGRA